MKTGNTKEVTTIDEEKGHNNQNKEVMKINETDRQKTHDRQARRNNEQQNCRSKRGTKEIAAYGQQKVQGKERARKVG